MYSAMISHGTSFKDSEKPGLQRKFTIQGRIQMYFETGELTFYLKLEKHILYISIDNVYAYGQDGTKVGSFECKIQE